MPVMIKDHDSNKITFEKAYAIAKQRKDQIATMIMMVAVSRDIKNK